MEHIKALKADNQNVFKRVYEQYHPQIYGFILQRTKSDYIAQEVRQLTCSKVWRRRDILSDDIRIRAQVCGVARQVMSDLRRKDPPRFKHEGQSAPTPYTDSLIDGIESQAL